MTSPAPLPPGEDAAPEPPTIALRRLKKRAEFLHVAQGVSAARGAVVIQARPREASTPDAGVGFTATKKIGGAVVRNRAKRRLREAARAVLPPLAQPGFDYVFVARQGTPDRPWARLLDDVRSALISLAAGGDGPRPPRSRSSGRSASKSRPRSG